MKIVPAKEISKAAFKESRMRAGTQKHRLLLSFAKVNDLTDLEAAYMSNLEDCEYWARCRELRQMGLIEQIEGTRPGKANSQRMICRITQKGRDKLKSIQENHE